MKDHNVGVCPNGEDSFISCIKTNKFGGYLENMIYCPFCGKRLMEDS